MQRDTPSACGAEPVGLAFWFTFGVWSPQTTLGTVIALCRDCLPDDPEFVFSDRVVGADLYAEHEWTLLLAMRHPCSRRSFGALFRALEVAEGSDYLSLDARYGILGTGASESDLDDWEYRLERVRAGEVAGCGAFANLRRLLESGLDCYKDS